MKTAALTILALAGLLALGWLFLANDTEQQRVFAPKREAIRRNTFEQSKAYNDGVAQDLNGMRRDYALADSTGKAMLAQVIRHRLAGYDTRTLSPDLQQFLSSLPE